MANDGHDQATDRFHSIENASASSLQQDEIKQTSPSRSWDKERHKTPHNGLVCGQSRRGQRVCMKDTSITPSGYILMFAMGLLGMKILYKCGGYTLHKLGRMSALGTMVWALIWS